MKTKILLFITLLYIFTIGVFADYAIDFAKMLGIRHAEPFTADDISYSPSDITDTDKMTYSSIDFQIQGKGRGSNLDLMFARYYNNKLNNDGICGFSFYTNLDINFQIVNGLYIVSDEKGELYVFNQFYSYPIGMIFKTVSKPNPHYLYEDETYYIFQKKYGNKYYFNKTLNLLEKIIDRNGNEITYVRDEFNKIISINDSSGRSITFTYNAAGKIETAKDPMDRVYTYGYDANNNLITVTDPLNNITTFEYQSPLDIHNITRITKPKGNHQSFEYNQDDQLTKVYDNNVEIWSLTHNEDLATTQITNAVGLQVLKMKLENGKKITTTDNFGTEIDELDDNGYLYKYTDKLNRITTMTRDVKGNVISMLNARGNTTTQSFNTLNKVTQMISPLNLIEDFQYDSKGNLLKYTNGEGGEWVFTYNAEGMPLTLKDPNLKITTFEYDIYGNLKKLTDANGGIREYTYDLCGNVLTYKDPNGFIYTYQYDLLNRTIKVTNPDNTIKTATFDNNGLISTLTNENGDFVTYTFNTLDKLASFTNEEGNTVQYTYDTIGRLQSQIDPKGFIYGFEYDARDRLTKKIFPDGSFVRYEYDAQSGNKVSDAPAFRPKKYIDALNNETIFEYNELYAKIKQIDPHGNYITYSYDELDRVNIFTNQLGQNTGFAYNDLYKIIKFTRADSSEMNFQYDLKSNLLASIDFNGKATSFTYNNLYDIQSTVNALGKVTQYSYNISGALGAIIDANNNSITYNYDNRNRIIKETDMQGNSTQYFYDSANNVIKKLYHDGTEVLFEYYKNGLLKTMTYPLNKTVLYEYDANYNLIKMTDWNGEINYTYDNRNRLTQKIEYNGIKVQYTYDVNNRRTLLKLLDSNGIELYSINYTYNSLNQLINMSDSFNNAVSFTYDAMGKRLTQEYSNGIKTEYTYDIKNALSQIKTLNSGGSTIFKLDYTHDLMGNILSETNETGFQKTYSYDTIYQLLGVNYTGGEFINYTYDDAGNRLTQNKNGLMTNYTYNNLNQLMQSVENGVTTQYSYDLKGNLIQSMNPSQTVNYQYNFMNKVASITKTGLENISLNFEYNSEGNRINKTYSDGKTFNYVYDGINVLKEESNIYSTPAYYLSGAIDQLFARTINNNAEFFIKDAINSLRVVTDNTGVTTNSIDYKPFGSLLSGDAGNHSYLYTGREKDFDNVYYYRNRTYSTVTGTFHQRDPIGVLGGLNLYSYVRNNPVNYLDPLGEAWITVHVSSSNDGDSKFGHASMEFNYNDGTNINNGSYPFTGTQNDSGRDFEMSYSWEVSDEKADAALKMTLKDNWGPLNNNCVSTVVDALNAAGIETPNFNNGLYDDPDKLFDWLNFLNIQDHLKI